MYSFSLTIVRVVVAVSLSLCLLACGGGGGNNGGNNNPTPTPTLAPTPTPTPTPTPDPGYLNINGGFESSDVGETLPDGWETNANNGSVATFAVVDDPVFSGNRAFEITVTTPSSGNPWDVQVASSPMTVSPDTTYELSVWLMGPPGATVSVTVGTPSPEFAYRGGAQVNLTGGWQHVNFQVVTQSGDTGLRIPLHFSFANNEGVTIYLDEVEFTEIDSTVPTPTPTPAPPANIRLNQIGFHAMAPKMAIVPDVPATQFSVVSDSDSSVVYMGDLSSAQTWTPSSESLKLADFSSVTTSGTYHIEVDGVANSHSFEIGGSDLYNDLHDATIKAYYFNRASTELLAEHAGVYARPAGHPDDDVLIHSSAAGPIRMAGDSISSPKGWYDAGDYNKYIVNSGISTYTLLIAYEHFPGAYSRDLNIPESGNDVPDILDEIMWNLEWMLTMQDPDDGGVYHKLTTLNFSGIQMPHMATAQRYVVKKSTAAALDFAAVMAAASRVLADFEDDLPAGKIAQMQQAAVDAWDWAQDNPQVVYDQDTVELQDVSTGEYGDGNFSDEFAWAAAELFILTGEQQYLDAFLAEDIDANVPGWPNVQALAFISLADQAEPLLTEQQYNDVVSQITSVANGIVTAYQNSQIRVPMATGDFYWGSNSVALNKAMMLIQAHRLDPQADYLNAAYAVLDYILGRNATEYSMVTGFGDVTPMGIHHRVSEADTVAAPVPGFVAGGPHSGQQDDCDYPSNQPAKSYLDDWCSYSTNEVTINWNAPMVYLLGALNQIAGSAE